jgi:hypothetical protein
MQRLGRGGPLAGAGSCVMPRRSAREGKAGAREGEAGAREEEARAREGEVDCWYGRVVLLFRIRVKLDKKDFDERSVRMDCDCAMIECLYDFAPGRCTCAGCAVGLQKVCTVSALCLH